ncbi:MAG: MarR family winged helix-turn-helix transcriptional regulator [Pseudomonadota bacterium]
MVTAAKLGQTAPLYRLDAQIGFILRRASQRHLAIFADRIPELTPQQLAVLARLCELGALSQNQLGRETAMDGATVKGVVDRLLARALVVAEPDLRDRRRLVVRLSGEGRALFDELAQVGMAVSAETLAPLDEDERQILLRLLEKIA